MVVFKCVIVYLERVIPSFVIYCVNGASRSSLLIESTDSDIIIMGSRLLINAVRNAILICNIIEASLSVPHTTVKNPPDIIYIYNYIYIIESVDSISRGDPDSSLTQYITTAGISRARYTITHFKHHHRVLRLIFNRISV